MMGALLLQFKLLQLVKFPVESNRVEEVGRAGAAVV
jgi:hypothetical protein